KVQTYSLGGARKGIFAFLTALSGIRLHISKNVASVRLWNREMVDALTGNLFRDRRVELSFTKIFQSESFSEFLANVKAFNEARKTMNRGNWSYRIQELAEVFRSARFEVH